MECNAVVGICHRVTHCHRVTTQLQLINIIIIIKPHGLMKNSTLWKVLVMVLVDILKDLA